MSKKKTLFISSLFIFLVLNLLTIFVFAEDKSYSIESQINLSIENQGRLGLEKDQIETQIKELQLKIKDKKTLLLQRARALHYLKDFQWGSLLTVTDSQLLTRNLKILNNLNQYDIHLFKEFRNAYKMLTQARIDLSNTQKELKQNITQLKQQQIDLINQEQKRLEEIKKGTIKSLLYFKGSLARPFAGKITIPFGSRTDRNNQYTLVSKGLLYQSQPGEKIHSVGPGVIIFSDQLNHWGQTLIIQHDDDYYSIYANVKADPKMLKSHVNKDDVLGTTSDDEFYFELRHFENPINPLHWFKENL